MVNHSRNIKMMMTSFFRTSEVEAQLAEMDERPSKRHKNDTKALREAVVVNVRVANIRPKYADLKIWSEDPNHEYIGRRGVVFVDGKRFPNKDSIWANPFKVTKSCSREEAVRQYEVHIRDRLSNDEELRKHLHSLQGKVLGCWCAPLVCHGDVLVRLAKEQN